MFRPDSVVDLSTVVRDSLSTLRPERGIIITDELSRTSPLANKFESLDVHKRVNLAGNCASKWLSGEAPVPGLAEARWK